MFSITDTEYDAFSEYLESASGIVLGSGKHYLVVSRLRGIVADNGYKSLTELLDTLKKNQSRELRQSVVDAMTTNETLWFRDGHPFKILAERILPEWQKDTARSAGKLKIWSAASSSGQEPYSVSITVEEYRRGRSGQARLPVEIVATDLSQKMLDQCREGCYDVLATRRGLSDERLKAYFEPQAENVWRVNQDIRSRVEFRPLNLMDNYFLLGKFDVIFCRNVLIYFSAEKKLDILTRMRAALNPGGYLFIGSTEVMPKEIKGFEVIRCQPGMVYKAV